MVIDERIVEDGSFERIHLELDGDRIVLRDRTGARSRVRLALILAVVRRYGRPLDGDIALPASGLALGPGVELRHLRYRALVDAAARDYAVLCMAEREPMAVLSTTFTAALQHLVTKDNES